MTCKFYIYFTSLHFSWQQIGLILKNSSTFFTLLMYCNNFNFTFTAVFNDIIYETAVSPLMAPKAEIFLFSASHLKLK